MANPPSQRPNEDATQVATTVLMDHDDTIVTLTLNRPHRRNALDEQMYGELHDAVRALHGSSTRVVIITGADGSFCSGADVGGLAANDVAAITRMRRHSDVARALNELPMPTIAAVDGPAVGAGCNLALGCDLVIASDRAVFGELFVKRGMGFDWGGSWLLPRLVGLRKAKEIAFFGDNLSAHDAFELGLINRLVPVAALNDTVDEWAQRLAKAAPLALTMMKEELHMAIGPSFSSMVGVETYGQIAARGTQDAAEGFASFRERREARFVGR